MYTILYTVVPVAGVAWERGSLVCVWDNVIRTLCRSPSLCRGSRDPSRGRGMFAAVPGQKPGPDDLPATNKASSTVSSHISTCNNVDNKRKSDSCELRRMYGVHHRGPVTVKL